MNKKRKSKKVTLSIDSEIYFNFRRYCEENAVMVSRKIEIWIEEFLKENKKEVVKNKNN